MNFKSFGVRIMDINSVQGTSYLPSAQEPTVPHNHYPGFSYAMGQASAAGGGLTPAVAQNLMHRSMTTGVPNSEFDKYGGYSAVKAMFDANGGSYSLDAIPADQRQQLAQVVANTGVGNMQLLVNERLALAPAALAAMAQNGIDQNTINSVQQKTKDGQQPSSQIFLSTAAIEVSALAVSTITPSEAQSLMHRSMTTGVPNSEFDKYGGYSVVKAMFDANGGSYSLDAIPADQRKALAMQVASTGVGNMSAPVAEKIGVSSAVLQAMAVNGIDKATIEQIKQKTIGFEQAPFVDSNSYINIFMKATDS
jgi:hypothetical protein